MKRTIASARAALEEDFAPTLSDYQMRQARAVLDAASTREPRRIAEQGFVGSGFSASV